MPFGFRRRLTWNWLASCRSSSRVASLSIVNEKMKKYDWLSGGYDYLQAFGMSPRNAAIAGYIIAVDKRPCTILDAACGLCPIIPFLPESFISRYVAFDNSQYVQEHLPYKGLEYFEFYRWSFEEFFSDSSNRLGSFDFVLYLGMYGGYDVYAERLAKLLPYAKPGGYVILEAIDEHITEALSVMQQKYPDYKEVASCRIQIHNGTMSDLTRERFRSIHLYHCPLPTLPTLPRYAEN